MSRVKNVNKKQNLLAEISFINLKLIKTEKKNNLQNYPITKLDYPNAKRNKEIKLIFN